ncbi:RAMP superfamily CRISPR-associated protein [Cylindrospermum sp. FACHB-282]|uniref:RAMP superfamily CRISPR-associated protein n=1 Tax=Cylindrospermum sp. FACHB-282 TaxID=2692794 RepID=UPI0016844DF4|nr:RAMP superfamily CRISPR-associated protein [Cylindrospermum sp. FACHB-282]MBD2384752.1 CRISPR-associated protein [Cylindrospermum sp. FACHB-282]
MTNIPKPKPRKPISSQPASHDDSAVTSTQKPYKFVSFPQERPRLENPAGHDRFHHNRLHGTLFLTLKAKTSLHVSTGVVVPGNDIASHVSLIKTMVQGVDKHLVIQGSSLKGCIRSVYEAITNSTLAVVTSRYRETIPSERLPCRNKEQLCPASQVFGALDWQGLIDFNDAKCESMGFNTGFMPSLYRPRPEPGSGYFDTRGKVAGRKFYYHTVRAIEKGQNQGIAVQQASREYGFTTQLQFKNLKPEELGTLFVVLGQDSNYPIALKVGGGKPIGMGTITLEVTQAKVLQNLEDLRSHYSTYTPHNNALTGEALQKFIETHIKTAHSRLIQLPQLQQLAEVLRYPTDREPPEGMY